MSQLIAKFSPAASQIERVAPWLVGGAYVVGLAAVCTVLIVNGPQLRAVAEAQKAEEINQENKVFCRKFGMGPETNGYTECSANLMQIRERHERRVASELAGLF
jgi:hypothetical protein